MTIYESGWTPKGVRKIWDRCSVGVDSANRIVNRYIDADLVDACGWFDGSDALKVLVAYTRDGDRIILRRGTRETSLQVVKEASDERA